MGIKNSFQLLLEALITGAMGFYRPRPLHRYRTRKLRIRTAAVQSLRRPGNANRLLTNGLDRFLRVDSGLKKNTPPGWNGVL